MNEIPQEAMVDNREKFHEPARFEAFLEALGKSFSDTIGLTTIIDTGQLQNLSQAVGAVTGIERGAAPPPERPMARPTPAAPARPAPTGIEDLTRGTPQFAGRPSPQRFKSLIGGE